MDGVSNCGKKRESLTRSARLALYAAISLAPLLWMRRGQAGIDAVRAVRRDLELGAHARDAIREKDSSLHLGERA